MDQKLRNSNLPTLTVPLNTGYKVRILYEDIEQSLSHLIISLLGQNFISNLRKKKSSWKTAIDKLHDGIHYSVSSLDEREIRTLAHLLIWKSCCEEYGKTAKICSSGNDNLNGKA